MTPAPATAATQPGYYGKLPGKGDFLSKAVPAGFREAWDGWLEPAVFAAEQRLGRDWPEIYLTSPLWRFAVDGGLLGDPGVAGIMMPSVDRVGRHYPFALIAAAPVARSPFHWAGTATAWYHAAEAAALDGLRDDHDGERFDRGVAAVGALPETDAGASLQGLAPGWVDLARRPTYAWRSDALVAMDAPAQHVFPALLDQAFRATARRFSLWWTRGSDRVDACFLVFPGLPEPDDYVAMIAGLETGASHAA